MPVKIIDPPQFFANTPGVSNTTLGFSEGAAVSIKSQRWRRSEFRMTVNGQPAILWLCLVAFAIGASHNCADDWPQWRGSNRNAVSGDTGLVKTWSDEGPPLEWRASEIGEGYSSVVVFQGLVFTTGRIDGEVSCFAINLKTGDKVWSTKIGVTQRNVMATPTVDHEFVYVLDPDGELICLKILDGEIVWQRNLVKDFGGVLMSSRGYGESPLIDGDRLICTPGGSDAMLVALDRRTGDVIWKSAIPDIGEKGAAGAAFSSIVIAEAADVRQYVQLVGRGLIGIDAETGRFLWGYNDICNNTVNIPTPLVRGDYVFSANGYHAGSVLLKIERDASENGLTAREVYRLKGNVFQNHHGGFVLIGDHVFGGHGSNNGLPTCIDFETGKIAWKQRGPGTGSASIVAADGHLYFHYQDGVIALIEANPEEYRLKATFQLPNAGGDSWSHPVISHGRLFLREKDQLLMYNLRSHVPGAHHSPDTTVPPEFAELIRLDASVEFTDRKDVDRYRIYRFAADDGIAEVPVIKLSNQHLEADGSLIATIVDKLHQLKSEFVLDVAGTPISVSGIRQAARLKQLVGLNLALCRKVDDAAFEPLKEATNLRILIATGTDIGAVGLAYVTELPDLAALDVEVCDNVSDDSCQTIAKIKQLRALVLKKTGFEPDRISADGLQQLAGLRDLELLNLYGNAISDETLQQLKPFGNLNDLDLSLTAITDEGLKHLAVLGKLTHLTLLYTEGFAGPQITNAGLKKLSTLTRLSHLNLVGAKVTDDGIDDLLQYRGLKQLTLIGTRISVDGLRRLRTELVKCDVISDQETANTE